MPDRLLQLKQYRLVSKLKEHEVVISGEQKGCVYVFGGRDDSDDDETYVVVEHSWFTSEGGESCISMTSKLNVWTVSSQLCWHCL